MSQRPIDEWSSSLFPAVESRHVLPGELDREAIGLDGESDPIYLTSGALVLTKSSVIRVESPGRGHLRLWVFRILLAEGKAFLEGFRREPDPRRMAALPSLEEVGLSRSRTVIQVSGRKVARILVEEGIYRSEADLISGFQEAERLGNLPGSVNLASIIDAEEPEGKYESDPNPLVQSRMRVEEREGSFLVVLDGIPESLNEAQHIFLRELIGKNGGTVCLQELKTKEKYKVALSGRRLTPKSITKLLPARIRAFIEGRQGKPYRLKVEELI